MSEISGQFRYAVRLYVDWLTERMPDVLTCTKIPSDELRAGRPVVRVSTLPGPPHPSRFLSWRRLIFGCHDERGEEASAELCERVRAQVRASRYAHVCRSARVLGEPARFDLDDEPAPRFQVSIDVLLRESYRRLTVVQP